MCKLTRFIVDPSTSGATTRGYTSTHGRAPSLELWNTRHDSLWYPLRPKSPTAGRPTHPRRALRSAQLSTGARKSTVYVFFVPGNQSTARSTQYSDQRVRESVDARRRAPVGFALALYWPVYARVDIASNTTISLLLNRARRGIGRQPLTRTRAHTGRAA
jgi:hypothetical protein